MALELGSCQPSQLFCKKWGNVFHKISTTDVWPALLRSAKVGRAAQAEVLVSLPELIHSGKYVLCLTTSSGGRVLNRPMWLLDAAAIRECPPQRSRSSGGAGASAGGSGGRSAAGDAGTSNGQRLTKRQTAELFANSGKKMMHLGSGTVSEMDDDVAADQVCVTFTLSFVRRMHVRKGGWQQTTACMLVLPANEHPLQTHPMVRRLAGPGEAVLPQMTVWMVEMMATI